MPLANRTTCISLLLSGFLSFTARSQAPSPPPAPSVDTSLNIPIQEYHNYLTPESGLYRGVQYVVYTHLLKEAHPFFDQDDLRSGSVLYKGVLYKDVPLKFDLVKQILITNDTRKAFMIGLISDEIDSFTIEKNIFIHYRDSLNTPFKPGFYQLTHTGKLTILKKEKKSIREQIEYSVINRYIDYSVAFYLKKDNTWFPVGSEKALLHAFGEQGPECKKFLRTNHLKFRQDKENTLLQAADWYENQHQ